MFTKSTFVLILTVTFACHLFVVDASTSSKVFGRRVVLANYLVEFGIPHFSGSWHGWEWYDCGARHNPDSVLANGLRDIASAYYPLIGPYDSTDPAVLRYHIELAQASGIDGFVVDWYGVNNPEMNGPRITSIVYDLLSLAERMNFTVAINYNAPITYLRHGEISNRTLALRAMRDDLAFALRNFASSPAYLRFGDSPVIFAFLSEWEGLKSTEWAEVYNALDSDGLHAYYVSLTVSDRELGFYPYFRGFIPWIWSEALKEPAVFISHEANVLQSFSQGHDITWGLSVRPGFDDYPVSHWCASGTPLRVDREDGRLYNETWEVSLSRNPSWIFISTFNDWGEATVIEPTLEFRYQYLFATAYYSAQFKHERPNYDEIPVPIAIYNATLSVRQALAEGRTVGFDPANQTLALAEQAFQAGQYSSALAYASQAKELADQAKIPQALTTTVPSTSTLQVPLQPVATSGWNVMFGVAVLGVVTLVAVSIIMRRRRTKRQ